ncbi:MAG: peptidylprolyl isomerase [Candidatus Doudnabacteria bacterium]|nr:peptidylprolyl isomerase [Candidatus Doudnabacteria bacterium]
MKLNKILIGLILIAAAIGAYFYFQSKKGNTVTENNQQNNPQSTTPTPQPETSPVPDTTVATVETSLGTFELTLNGKAAPKTVENFVKLSKDGFYNNLTFHRIVKQQGFHLIQGGDPKGDGTGGPDYTVPAEIGLKHTKGAVAMARLGDEVNPTKASSGSQFYIVEEDIPFLDGNYTVFGYVTKGMDVVEKIGAVATGVNDKPVTPVVIKKITIK